VSSGHLQRSDLDVHRQGTPEKLMVYASHP
jgi:hypothetical protein